MRINNNLMAMNTHRQLGAANAGGAKSMEKLSSGMRINRAGDDAAGLAISEKMRGQIRGLNQAAANSQDGISMIQTAEGALNETHAILQRMRELSVQSANDTNVGIDRGEIQKEMNQLTSEINRIGNTTEFNTQKILKGSEASVETNPALKLDGIGSTTAAPTVALMPGGETKGGKTIDATGAEVVLNAVADTGGSVGGKSIKINLQGEEITINFATGAAADPVVSDDGKTVTMNVASGALVKAVGDSIETALKAAIEKNGKVDSDAYNITTAADGKVTIESKVKGADQFINVTGDAAVAPSVVGTGTDVSYRASDVGITFGTPDAAGLAALPGQGITINGQSVEFYDAKKGVYDGKADFAVDINGVTTGAGIAKAISDQLGDKLDGVKLSIATGVRTAADGQGALAVGDLVVTSTADGAKGDAITVTDGVDIAAKTSADTFTSKFQVGANSGQSMQIDISDMRSLAIGISGNEAGATIAAKNGVEASYVSTKNVSNGTDNDSVEYALDVSTHDKAQAATSVINDAIERVSSQRSDLGAYQNRLEHTINNLDTSAENLQASEARIRDVDMAKEMMEQTRQNILAQASTAMLAQANQAPQAVLQLLR